MRRYTPTPYRTRYRRRRSSLTGRLTFTAVGVVIALGLYWLRNRELPTPFNTVRVPNASVPFGATPDSGNPSLPGGSADTDWTGGLVSANPTAVAPRPRPVDALSPAWSYAASAPELLTALAPDDVTTRSATADDGPRENADIAAARRTYAAGQIIEARHQLNAFLVRSDLTPAELADVRDLLAKIADESLFSARRVQDDPLIETYDVADGDNLERIAKRYDTPYEIIMEINGIQQANRLRAGQKIKVLRGPFHARIYKSQCRLDVYLQDLYVRSYRVAIGSPSTPTPEGLWKVTLRQPDPTYHPAPSAAVHKVIAADDPTNPLGEFWIGLEGIDGPAVGQQSYGIHGTIEPDSIGKAVSDGCIRLHDADIAFLFRVLVVGKSTVTIVP